MTEPKLDLLASKRAELGLSSVQPVAQPSSVLLLKGAAVAAVLIGLAGVAVVMVGRQEQQLLASINALTPAAAQADRLQAQIASLRAQSKPLQQSIASITSSLVAIRSGSAFMEQLKRVTPSSVQLRKVSVGSSRVEMDGVVRQQRSEVGPLKQINALALNLEGLAGVPAEGAVLQNVTRSKDGAVEFDLELRVDASHKSTADQLFDLGAVGLARRHQWLRDQGLPL